MGNIIEKIKTGFYGIECEKQGNEYYIYSSCGFDIVLGHRPTKEDFENFVDEVQFERRT